MALKISPWATDSDKLLDKRKKMKMNQTDFWTPICVTQSGGSRYEKGDHGIPAQVQMLLTIAYGNKEERESVLKHLADAGKAAAESASSKKPAVPVDDDL